MTEAIVIVAMYAAALLLIAVICYVYFYKLGG